MIQGDQRGGTLGPLIWCFCLCVFYLLPAIWLYKYIGWWSLLPTAAFWAGVWAIFYLLAQKFKGGNNADQ